MQRPPKRRLSRTGRVIFSVWVTLATLAFLFVTLAGPFERLLGDLPVAVGAIIPPVLVLLIGIGLGWLLWRVLARPNEIGSD